MDNHREISILFNADSFQVALTPDTETQVKTILKNHNKTNLALGNQKFPILEIEGNSLCSRGIVQTESSFKSLETFTQELGKILKNDRMTVDIFDVCEQRGSIFIFSLGILAKSETYKY